MNFYNMNPSHKQKISENCYNMSPSHSNSPPQTATVWATLPKGAVHAQAAPVWASLSMELP